MHGLRALHSHHSPEVHTLCLALAVSGSRPGCSGAGHQEPLLPPHSQPSEPPRFPLGATSPPFPLQGSPPESRAEGLQEGCSREGAEWTGFGLILQMLPLAPHALDHGMARATTFRPRCNVCGTKQSSALPCRPALSRPDLLPTLPCAHSSPICHPASSGLLGFWSCH